MPGLATGALCVYGAKTNAHPVAGVDAAAGMEGGRNGDAEADDSADQCPLWPRIGALGNADADLSDQTYHI